MKSALEKAREAPSSTKARILNAAEEVFAVKGFDGASTREIASKAGVNISSLHYHWESKETLYFAVFQDIYDRIIKLAQRSVEPSRNRGLRAATDAAMGELIDFFLDHPNVPRLLLRRVLESATETTPPIEHDILSPAWAAFTGLMRDVGLQPRRKLDAQLFMLSVNSILLLFTLDSQAYQNLLGDSLKNPTLRRAVRKHIIDATMRLLEWDDSCEHS
jgi:AcrR family transcriptional regulator